MDTNNIVIHFQLFFKIVLNFEMCVSFLKVLCKFCIYWILNLFPSFICF